MQVRDVNRDKDMPLGVNNCDPKLANSAGRDISSQYKLLLSLFSALNRDSEPYSESESMFPSMDKSLLEGEAGIGTLLLLLATSGSQRVHSCLGTLSPSCTSSRAGKPHNCTLHSKVSSSKALKQNYILSHMFMAF